MKRLRLHAHYGRIAHFLFRLGFSIVVYKLVRAYERNGPASEQMVPNGLAHFIDFSFFGNHQVFFALKIALIVALVLYVLRVGVSVAVGFMLFMVVGLGTLFNSQGAVSHNKQAVGLILVGQFCAYSYGAILRRRRCEYEPKTDLTIDDLAVYFSQQMLAVTYVAAGVSKLIHSKGMFVFLAPNLATAIAKTHEQDYYKKLDPAILDKGETVVQFFLNHPTLVSIAFAGALALELFAFLAVANRTLGLLIGFALIAFHLGVSYTMELQFPWNIYCVIIFYVNVPWIVESLVRRASGRRSQERPRPE